MAQQKSERRIVLQPHRKVGVTASRQARGGKAAPVKQRTSQLGLSFETADTPRAQVRRGRGGLDRGVPLPGPRAAPKSKVSEEHRASARMGQVCRQLRTAFQHVAANKGAPGPDRQTIEEVRENLPVLLPALTEALLSGDYQPGDIRRVWIPKAGGGERGLGIPNVVDRMVAEAVRLVLEPVYEPTFHEASHGFRPKRSCHTAVIRAKSFVEEGYEWVVDLDLERFFDRVHHQRLLARLAQRVPDKPLLTLIGKMLKARVVLPDGVVVSTDEGVPQGGPLSPLLSNIVLDELDQELSRRGHRFVRYADDCNIYVRSERAGKRVMASVVKFIEGRMRLVVNTAKSAVARPEERHFLGFRLRREPLGGEVEVLLSKRSEERLDKRIRELTPRTWGNSLVLCIQAINVYLLGWISFFGILTFHLPESIQALQKRDAHIRRRLRAIQLKHWKRKRTIARKLIQLGVKAKTAWGQLNKGRRSLWALSHTYATDTAMPTAYFVERRLLSLEHLWKSRSQHIQAPEQLLLPLG